MAKKIIGGVLGIFGKKKKAAAATEETGPKVTPLGSAAATGKGIKGALAYAKTRQAQTQAPTILSDKLGS